MTINLYKLILIGCLVLITVGCTLSLNISDLNSTSNSLVEKSKDQINGIILSSNTINEYSSLSSTVGELSVINNENLILSAGINYSLVSGDGDDDNLSFAISNSSVLTNDNLIFQSKSSYSIRIKAEDSFGNSLEEIKQINVNNINLPLVPSTNVNVASSKKFQMTPTGGAGPYQYTLLAGSTGTLNASGEYTAPASNSILQESQILITDANGESETLTINTPAAGSIDLSYISGDIISNGINEFELVKGSVISTAIDTSGKTLVLVKNTNSSLVRFNSDGSIDSNFGISGSLPLGAIITSTVTYMTIDNLNRIYVGAARSGSGEVYRFSSAGSLDTAFGVGGKTDVCLGCSANSISITAMAFDSSNNFAVVGGYIVVPFFNSARFLQKFNNVGNADLLFNGGSPITQNPTSGVDSFESVAIDNLNQVIAVGYDDWFTSVTASTSFYRYNSSGVANISSQFDGSDSGIMDGAMLTKVDSSGNIYIVGYAVNNIYVRKYLTSGGLDPTFSGDGKTLIPIDGVSGYWPRDFEFDEQNRIIISARHMSLTQIGMFRLNSDGSLDSTFGGSGVIVIDPVTTVADSSQAALNILPNGQILVFESATSGSANSHIFKIWP
jgi:uncharacterized delta-60 repeat protein